MGIPVLTWASAHDQTGSYGLDHVECEFIQFSGPTPFSLRSLRGWFKVMKFITEV